MVSSRFKKLNGPKVPNLQFGGQEEPSTRGQPDRSRNSNNSKKDTGLKGSRGATVSRRETSSMTLPMSTPRGTSSYKDILLTPRMAPHQHAGFEGFQTSRAMQQGRGTRQGNMNRSPLTARAPMRSRASDEVKSKDNNASRTLYTLAKHVEYLEQDNKGNIEIARSISKSIQVAASMIGVPVGILEMLQMHEQQRMTSRIQTPRAVPVPKTPDHTAQFQRIRTKLSDIEQALQNTE